MAGHNIGEGFKIYTQPHLQINSSENFINGIIVEGLRVLLPNQKSIFNSIDNHNTKLLKFSMTLTANIIPMVNQKFA